MKRLIWKEFREKRLVGLALCAAAVGPILMGTGYTFSGPIQAFTPWCLLSVWVAFFLGAGVYGSEITGGAADFFCSRPISWKRALAAKLLVGLGMVVFTAVFAAVVYRFACAPQYVRFASFPNLAIGAGWAIVLVGAAYLIGAACSLALPGGAGGLLLFLLLIVLAVGQGMIYQNVFTKTHYWSIFGWILGPTIAAVLVARFGVTLPTAGRFQRYALVTVVTVLVLVPLDFSVRLPGFLSGSKTLGGSITTTVSPDGQYALYWASTERMIRLSDGLTRQIPMSAPGIGGCVWSRKDAAVFVDGTLLWKVWMDEDGAAHTRYARVNSLSHLAGIESSPDRGLAAVWGDFSGLLPGRKSHKGERNTTRAFSVQALSLESLRPVHPVIIGVRDFWWQSETQVGYIDAHGKRHIVTVK